jgi:hypothetical protein
LILAPEAFIADLKFNDDRLIITVRWSKTNQKGEREAVTNPFGSQSGNLSGAGAQAMDRGGGDRARASLQQA